MVHYVGLWLGLLTRCLPSHRSLLLENLALRQQLAVLKRKHPRPRMGGIDKIFWVFARRFWGCPLSKPRALIKSTSCNAVRRHCFANIGAMFSSLRHISGWILSAVSSRKDLVLENLALRQQLLALHTKRPRRRLSAQHKVFWVLLRKLWSG